MKYLINLVEPQLLCLSKNQQYKYSPLAAEV